MKTPRLTIPLDAPALARGVGFFETLWVLGRSPVFFERHFQRLNASCVALEVPAPARQSVIRAVRKAGETAPRAGEAAMRWSYLALGRDIDDPRSWRFFANAFPIPAEIAGKRRGVRAITLPSTVARSAPRWKTIDYKASVAGLRLARGTGANEALFVDSRGRVLEGTSCNIFSMSGRRARTPSLSAGILPGVVRSWVLDNASRAGIMVREENFAAPVLELGGFVSSSVTGIAPIISLDGRRCVPPGRRFGALRELFQEDAAEDAARMRKR